jgi:hypothetical protein
MSRLPLRLAAAVASVLAVAAGAAAPATAVTATSTPASGNAAISESNAFFQSAATAGIVAVPLPTATAAYNSTTGLSATFPVTGGKASIPGFYGTIQLGGGLLIVDAATGTAVTFHQLAFSVDNWQLTGVADGTTTAVALFDPAGNNVITKTGTTQNLAASDLQVDAQAAGYLDTQLKTTFFTAGQSVGSLSLAFTPAS